MLIPCPVVPCVSDIQGVGPQVLGFCNTIPKLLSNSTEMLIKPVPYYLWYLTKTYQCHAQNLASQSNNPSLMKTGNLDKFIWLQIYLRERPRCIRYEHERAALGVTAPRFSLTFRESLSPMWLPSATVQYIIQYQHLSSIFFCIKICSGDCVYLRSGWSVWQNICQAVLDADQTRLHCA